LRGLGELLYVLLSRRRIESGTTNRWLDRFVVGRWFGPPTAGASSYSERRDLRAAAGEYDERIRKAKDEFEKVERKLGPADPRVRAVKAELESALADVPALDASWSAWDAQRHKD
jgi:hypothetical protein